MTTIFLAMKAFSDTNFSLVNRAIETTKNEFVDELNEKFIDSFLGDLQEYINRDKCIDDG